MRCSNFDQRAVRSNQRHTRHVRVHLRQWLRGLPALQRPTRRVRVQPGEMPPTSSLAPAHILHAPGFFRADESNPSYKARRVQGQNRGALWPVEEAVCGVRCDQGVARHTLPLRVAREVFDALFRAFAWRCTQALLAHGCQRNSFRVESIWRKCGVMSDVRAMRRCPV